ncbi:hypothetical protein RhiirA5_445463 [Rhizophagus irregularis]|uniref:Uncharacterized protein n=1 Tax=Rhizophagus irregularis TaxID=588596 RepID=A0A2N0NCC8_9GLOM|nr:hypothetical protein RhiirA5_445463 [Rhizophagus irregularis]
MRIHKAISRVLKFPKSTVTDTIIQYKNFNTGLMAKRRHALKTMDGQLNINYY